MALVESSPSQVLLLLEAGAFCRSLRNLKSRSLTEELGSAKATWTFSKMAQFPFSRWRSSETTAIWIAHGTVSFSKGLAQAFVPLNTLRFLDNAFKPKQSAKLAKPRKTCRPTQEILQG